VPAEGNGDLQTLICVLVARPRRCLTLSNRVPWQNWMAAYLGYTLRMRTLFHGWPIIVNDTHTRRRSERCDVWWTVGRPLVTFMKCGYTVHWRPIVYYSTLIANAIPGTQCYRVARPRRCLTSSNRVPWQNWMAAYLGYTLRMKTLFRGWPVMAHETHTRRRRRMLPFSTA